MKSIVEYCALMVRLAWWICQSFVATIFATLTSSLVLTVAYVFVIFALVGYGLTLMLPFQTWPLTLAGFLLYWFGWDYFVSIFREGIMYDLLLRDHAE